jgi:hypothetical protein
MGWDGVDMTDEQGRRRSVADVLTADVLTAELIGMRATWNVSAQAYGQAVFCCMCRVRTSRWNRHYFKMATS